MKKYLLLGVITAGVLAILACARVARPVPVSTVTLVPQTATKTAVCPAVVSDRTHLQAFVRESLASTVHVGQAASVSGVGFQQAALRGTVTAVADHATVQGGKTGLVAVVTLSETDDSIKKGLSATARITVTTFEHVAVLPNEWLFSDGDETYVMVAENGKAVRKPVRAGDFVSGGVIVSGLAFGERVLTDPHAVTDHQRIKEQSSK